MTDRCYAVIAYPTRRRFGALPSSVAVNPIAVAVSEKEQGPLERARVLEVEICGSGHAAFLTGSASSSACR